VAASVEGRLRWFREVEHARMPDIYRSVALSGGCMVSTSVAESFGMAVLEAMACGCPVVVPDIEGLRDLVQPDETGRLYPAGDIAAACTQILATLQESSEGWARISQAARRFALQFDTPAATDRFLGALYAFQSPPETAPAPAVAENLPTVPAFSGTPVILPPAIAWDAEAVSGRPRRWARTLAARGCTVFYCDPQHAAAAGFVEVEPRIFIANVPLQAFQQLQQPVVIAQAQTLEQLSAFANPRVIYDCPNIGEPRSPLEEEWLARAGAVTVPSEAALAAIAPLRPDAVLLPEAQASWEEACAAILHSLDHSDARKHDPMRLQALLQWREKQVDRLERQIRERDRPAVDILHGAVTEQKRIIAERDKGIAFLRREVANRDGILSEREQAIEYLKNQVAERDQLIASHNEDAGRELGAIESLRQDVADLERAIAERDERVELLLQETERRDRSLASNAEDMEFLRKEVAERDRTIAARDEGIAFLRQEIADRDQVIAELRNAVRDLESRLPWWSRRGK
jgi:hypothetical protein